MTKRLLWKSLLSIVHSIYPDVDQSPSLDVRANLLDISKTFDKVWCRGLLYKLETVRNSGNLHKLFRSCFSDRLSNRSPTLAGVPQVSILKPLLLSVYINDLPVNLESLAKSFADDTSLFSTVYNPLLSADIMNKDLIKFS